MAGFRRLSGPGAELAYEAVRNLRAAKAKAEAAAAMAGAVFALDGAASMEGPEFGSPSGVGQAVHDEVQAINAEVIEIFTENAGLLAQYTKS